MSAPCLRSVTLQALLDYLGGDLPPAESEDLEEHLFGCEACTSRLEGVTVLGEGVKRLVRRGSLPIVLTDALSARLASDGARTREFRIEPGGATPCGVANDDEILIVHLVADLAGAVRASLTLRDEAGHLEMAHHDVPLDAARSAVRVAYSGEALRALPDMIVHLRLITEVNGQAPRTAEYTLVHTQGGPPLTKL